jgi:hypothetical protein
MQQPCKRPCASLRVTVRLSITAAALPLHLPMPSAQPHHARPFQPIDPTSLASSANPLRALPGSRSLPTLWLGLSDRLLALAA